MQVYCIVIASNFVLCPQMLIFLVLKTWVSFHMLIAIKIFHVTVLLVIYFCDQFVALKFVQQASRQCLSTINTVFSDEDKILI